MGFEVDLFFEFCITILLVRLILDSIHTIFELSMRLVCPTTEISILLITDTFPWQNSENRSTSNAIYPPT